MFLSAMCPLLRLQPHPPSFLGQTKVPWQCRVPFEFPFSFQIFFLELDGRWKVFELMGLLYQLVMVV